MQNTIRAAVAVASMAVAALGLSFPSVAGVDARAGASYWPGSSTPTPPDIPVGVSGVDVRSARFGSLTRNDTVVTGVSVRTLGTGDIASIVGAYCDTNVVPRISELEHRVDTIYDGTGGSGASVDARLDALELWKSGAGPTIETLNAWKSSASASITGFQDSISFLEDQVSGIKATLLSHEVSLNSLANDRVSALETFRASANDRIDALDAHGQETRVVAEVARSLGESASAHAIALDSRVSALEKGVTAWVVSASPGSASTSALRSSAHPEKSARAMADPPGIRDVLADFVADEHGNATSLVSLFLSSDPGRTADKALVSPKAVSDDAQSVSWGPAENPWGANITVSRKSFVTKADVDDAVAAAVEGGLFGPWQFDPEPDPDEAALISMSFSNNVWSLTMARPHNPIVLTAEGSSDAMRLTFMYLGQPLTAYRHVVKVATEESVVPIVANTVTESETVLTPWVWSDRVSREDPVYDALEGMWSIRAGDTDYLQATGGLYAAKLTFVPRESVDMPIVTATRTVTTRNVLGLATAAEMAERLLLSEAKEGYTRWVWSDGVDHGQPSGDDTGWWLDDDTLVPVDSQPADGVDATRLEFTRTDGSPGVVVATRTRIAPALSTSVAADSSSDIKAVTPRAVKTFVDAETRFDLVTTTPVFDSWHVVGDVPDWFTFVGVSRFHDFGELYYHRLDYQDDGRYADPVGALNQPCAPDVAHLEFDVVHYYVEDGEDRSSYASVSVARDFTAQLADRAINSVSVPSGGVLVFPAPVAGKSRDFVVQVSNSGSNVVSVATNDVSGSRVVVNGPFLVADGAFLRFTEVSQFVDDDVVTSAVFRVEDAARLDALRSTVLAEQSQGWTIELPDAGASASAVRKLDAPVFSDEEILDGIVAGYVYSSGLGVGDPLLIALFRADDHFRIENTAMSVAKVVTEDTTVVSWTAEETKFGRAVTIRRKASSATDAAIDARLTRAEAESGYTRWTVDSEYSDVVIDKNEYGWRPMRFGRQIGMSITASDDDVRLEWVQAYGDANVDITATRTRITPRKASQLANDGDGTSPFATVSQIPAVPAISTDIADDSASDTNTVSPKAVKDFVDSVVEAWQYTNAITRADIERGITEWVVTPMWPLPRLDVGVILRGLSVGQWSLFPHGSRDRSSDSAVVTPIDGVPDRHGNVMSLKWPGVKWNVPEEWTNRLDAAGIRWTYRPGSTSVVVSVDVSARRIYVQDTSMLEELSVYATNNYELAARGNFRAKAIEAWQYTNAITRADIERGMTEWAITPMWPLSRLDVGIVSDGPDAGKWSLFPYGSADRSSSAAFVQPIAGVRDPYGDVVSLEWPNVQHEVAARWTNELDDAGISWAHEAGSTNVVVTFSVKARRLHISAGGVGYGGDISSLPMSVWYPDGSVTSRDQWTQGLRYTFDVGSRTAHVNLFVRSSDASVTNNDGVAGTVVIPPYVDHGGVRYVVTAIGFSGTFGSRPLDRSASAAVTSVVAPVTVEHVGWSAFEGCKSLVSVSFPGVVAVWPGAFTGCSALSRVSLPSVNNMYLGCFTQCTSLSLVDFGNSLTVVPYAASDAFYLASSNVTFVVPDAIYDTWSSATWGSAGSWRELVLNYPRGLSGQPTGVGEQTIMLNPTYVRYSEWEFTESSGVRVASPDGVRHYVGVAITNTVTAAFINELGAEVGLSSEDRSKLDGIETGAQTNVIESVKVNGTALPVSSKSVNIDLSGYANVKPNWNSAAGADAEILNKPTVLSQFLNDRGFVGTNDVCAIVTNVSDRWEYTWTANDIVRVGGMKFVPAAYPEYGEHSTWHVQFTVSDGGMSFDMEAQVEGEAYDTEVSFQEGGIVARRVTSNALGLAMVSDIRDVVHVSGSSMLALGTGADAPAPSSFAAGNAVRYEVQLAGTATVEQVNSIDISSLANKTAYVIEGEPGWITNQSSAESYPLYVVAGAAIMWNSDGRWNALTDKSLALGEGSVALSGGMAQSQQSVAVGGAISSGWRTFAEGGTHTQALGDYSHAEGDAATSVGKASHAEGGYTVASGGWSHAEGNITESIGSHSHAEGYRSKSFGKWSHAEGNSAIASNSYAHAEGDSTVASGASSHAEGQRATASGAQSHAEGRDTVSSGQYSHAEGINAKAYGYGSHAEGYGCVASNSYAHAEGQSSKALGNTSHAEGGATIASGDYSHAEGRNTKAEGHTSSARGYQCYTTAIATNSWAGGINATANAANCFVWNSDTTRRTGSTKGRFYVFTPIGASGVMIGGGGAATSNLVDIVGSISASKASEAISSSVFTNSVKEIAVSAMPARAEKTYAMFVIPLNFPGDAVSYCDIELKASTNNFSASAESSLRAVYYSHTSLAPEALNTDGIRIYAENISGDMRSYTKINVPYSGLPDGDRIPALVAIVSRDVCMRNQGGEWLYEDNDELVWTYCRSSVGGRENDSAGRALWRPIAPVKWFSKLPKWAE